MGHHDKGNPNVRGRGLSRRTWRCPDDTRLAAYSEHRLAEKTMHRIERHIADCERCTLQLAFLIKAEDLPLPFVPPALLARVPKAG